MVAYPVVLKGLSVLEQRQLQEDFYSLTVDDIDSGETTLPVWESWPPVILKIPVLNVEVFVAAVEDINILDRQLNHPPAHYPGTAVPGEDGNLVIAGHRGGPAGFFKNVNRLQEGDAIILLTPAASYHYRVVDIFITERNDMSVLENSPWPTLTLTTCQRVGVDSAAKRLIVTAELDKVLLESKEDRLS